MTAFNPVDLYKFASQIHYQESEVVYRTVINRAYYSAFLSAREFSGIKNSSGSVHQEVLTYLKKRNTKIFNQLSDLLNLRHQADYLLILQVNKRLANESLRLAKSILKELDYLTV